MASPVANAVLASLGAHRALSGETGRFGRDGLGDVEVVGVRGRSGVDGSLVDDVAVLDTDAQWLFKRTDLVLDSQAITPAADDTWIVTLEDGRQEHFEVLPPTAGERCWQPSDHQGLLIRVFMKLRKTTEPPV